MQASKTEQNQVRHISHLETFSGEDGVTRTSRGGVGGNIACVLRLRSLNLDQSLPM